MIVVEVTQDKCILRRSACPDDPGEIIVHYSNHLAGAAPGQAGGVPAEVQAAAVRAAADLAGAGEAFTETVKRVVEEEFAVNRRMKGKVKG